MPAETTDKVPFFIVGMGRSGSTFLYHLLEAHPRIALTNESRVFDFFYLMYRMASLSEGEEATSDVFGVDRFQGIMAAPHHLVFRGALVAPMREAITEFYERSFAGKDWTHYGDKLPSINAAVEFRRLEPSTRYIELLRDPRDIAVSVRKVKWPIDLERTCEMWCGVHEQVHEIEDRMQIRYEDLIREPLRCAERALTHLGLTMDEACKHALEANSTVSWHGTSRTPESSVGRWKGELDSADQAFIEKRCGPLMREQGYLE